MDYNYMHCATQVTCWHPYPGSILSNIADGQTCTNASATSNMLSLPASNKGRSCSLVKRMGNTTFAEKSMIVVALESPEQISEDNRSLV
jgi:hypothetical protein